MADEWGSWIEHDGRGFPQSLFGAFIEVEAETHLGDMIRQVGSAPLAHVHFHKHWDWRFFGKPSGLGWAWCRVIRYRIRRPRGLTILQDLLATLPETEKVGA